MKNLNLFKHPAFQKLTLIAFLAVGAITSLPLSASHKEEHRVDTDSRLSGNSLEHEFWAAVQNHNDHVLKELISPIYLGGNLHGTRDIDAEIALLKALAITDFTISNVVESQDEDIRIISYDFVASGAIPIIDHRISVWERKKHKHHQFFWQLISQSAFSINP